MPPDWPITWEQMFGRIRQAGADLRQQGQEDLMCDYLDLLHQEIEWTERFLREQAQAHIYSRRFPGPLPD